MYSSSRVLRGWVKYVLWCAQRSVNDVPVLTQLGKRRLYIAMLLRATKLSCTSGFIVWSIGSTFKMEKMQRSRMQVYLEI